MKWTKEQEAELREMCMAGKSNVTLAAHFGATLNDIYAARSRLRITIERCGTGDVPKPRTPRPKPSMNEALALWLAEQLLRGIGYSVKHIERMNRSIISVSYMDERETLRVDASIFSPLYETVNSVWRAVVKEEAGLDCNQDTGTQEFGTNSITQAGGVVK